MRNHPESFSTRAIHHGYDPMENEGALTPPLHLTSTFAFETAEAGGEMFAGERAGHIYSRISNPTCTLLEKRIAVLEGAEAGLALASGMGAITATMWTLLAPGDEIILDKTLYGCTFSFMQHGLAKFGVTVTHVDLTNPENLTTAISDKTKVVYFETPANPNMRLVDIQAVSDIAHANSAYVVVDNTYATPYLTQPITHGADIVLHSATKYLGGHGDVVAGLLVGSEELVTQIRLYGMKDMTGAVMAPFNAMLILRGLKTLELRMDRHCSSAATVAAMLEQSYGVQKVWYPGLESFEQRDVATRQMSQFGGMIAFELEGGYNAGCTMMNKLKMITRAVSLGDAETLVQHPASMTHSTYTPEERALHGISEGLVRLSIGLEGIDDVIADIVQALPKPAASKAA
ncbi:methionine gamma-lyase [Halocynthiibacter styelae]|uniref:L-methionine gamma-lyase n=1 Tax=Halocynthiibacter styelae TaxID=2761955 RepID=A0A8J7IX32_9RHOB|nr:methionine gamma-lyase [Paenihalocynthiibacter styelae]MBI1494508.1 methionine gamma-lyase [Paenihalocynthiibacter styelae]